MAFAGDSGLPFEAANVGLLATGAGVGQKKIRDAARVPSEWRPNG
jgi:hypothetical protein